MVWAKGFGYANVEKRVTATPATCYHLASLTKTFASTIIMQLVEEGLLDLDDPVSKYGIELQSPSVVRVKHLLTHTSEGTPGAAFRYNGGRFGLLDDVIIGASGRTFCELLVERIIKPLELKYTAPNLLSPNNCLLTWPERVQFAEYLAQGYTSDGQNRQAYPDYFGVSAGLISSVVDVAKYSIAIDNNMFLREETKALVFSPTISINGQTLPYGLGWFVQNYRGVKLVWHYGYWTANSSLIIKVPERELAFIILANTDMLSRAFPNIGNGDISVSVVALEFLNAFVFGGAVLPNNPVVDF
jgi:CubicO group peptidase (beta-lactamase class C family)